MGYRFDPTKHPVMAKNMLTSKSRIATNTGASIIVLNTQTRSPNRPSLKYSSGGSGPLMRYDEIAYCLPTSGGGGNYIIFKEEKDDLPRNK